MRGERCEAWRFKITGRIRNAGWGELRLGGKEGDSIRLFIVDRQDFAVKKIAQPPPEVMPGIEPAWSPDGSAGSLLQLVDNGVLARRGQNFASILNNDREILYSYSTPIR
jgi:hypothetical protein